MDDNTLTKEVEMHGENLSAIQKNHQHDAYRNIAINVD